MESHETFNVNDSCGLLLGRTAKLMAEHLQRRFATTDLGITMGHWIILAQLWHEDGLSQQEISRRSGVAKPNVTTMVDALEEESYIVRIPDQIDRRINRIYLTQKAKDMRCNAVRQAISVNDTAFEGLSADEQRTFFRALSTVMKNLQAHSTGCGNSGCPSSGI
jgi:DNA-binding MarR family transcriptional regulator